MSSIVFDGYATDDHPLNERVKIIFSALVYAFDEAVKKIYPSKEIDRTELLNLIYNSLVMFGGTTIMQYVENVSEGEFNHDLALDIIKEISLSLIKGIERHLAFSKKLTDKDKVH